MMGMEQTGTATVSPKKERRQRPTRIGVVTSDKRDKTIRVTVEYTAKHPKYGKYLKRRATLHAHDEKNDACKGDRVEVMFCRPMSKTKFWRLVRIIEKAPQGDAA